MKINKLKALSAIAIALFTNSSYASEERVPHPTMPPFTDLPRVWEWIREHKPMVWNDADLGPAIASDPAFLSLVNNARSRLGYSFLHGNVRFYEPYVKSHDLLCWAQVVLQNGADPDVLDAHGKTALAHIASRLYPNIRFDSNPSGFERSQRLWDILSVLFEVGANPNKGTITPMMYALYNENKKLQRELLKRGASIPHPDDTKRKILAEESSSDAYERDIASSDPHNADINYFNPTDLNCIDEITRELQEFFVQSIKAEAEALFELDGKLPVDILLYALSFNHTELEKSDVQEKLLKATSKE